MQQIEENVIESFRLAKNDIMKLQEEIVRLSQIQERLMEHIHINDQKIATLSKKSTPKTVTKVVKVSAPKSPKKTVKRKTRRKATKKQAPKQKKKTYKYVGSTDSKVYHATSARISKMIKPKNRVYSDSPKYLEKLGMKASRELELSRRESRQKAAKKAQKTISKSKPKRKTSRKSTAKKKTSRRAKKKSRK